MRRKNQKRGVSFTIMVAGPSGSGKTTFINTLCEANVLNSRVIPPADVAAEERTLAIIPKTFGMQYLSLEMEEDGTKISLTVIDTPGFGDNIDNEKCFQEILKYIEDQYDEVLAQESKIKRNPKYQGDQY
jgi:cell division control protein 11